MAQEQPKIFAFADSFAVSPQDLHERFLAIYDERSIILDLRGVDTINPSFLAELAQMREYRRQRGLLLGRLVADSRALRAALSAVGFERHCPIFKTLDDAIASFTGAPLYS